MKGKELIEELKQFILENRIEAINVSFKFYTNIEKSIKGNEYSVLVENKKHAIELMKGILGERYDDCIEIGILKSLRKESIFETRPFHLIFY